MSFFSARPLTSRRAQPPDADPSESADPKRYKPLLEIGRGGMGVVTLALARGPEGFAELVVLKRLHEHLVADPESVQMLLEEARISARISHPNVVQVYEATLQGGSPTIVMEYLEGQPLPVLTEGAVPLPLPLHLAALTQALGTGSIECEVGQKSCDGQCVSIERPEHGCGASTCAACAPSNATARCGRDNACGVAMCYRGYDDCDGIAENGCEVFLRTDPQHCGSCSKACPELPHAQVGCGDTCRIWRCAPGYEDCNGVTSDGCEVALQGDAMNCGACGARCSAKLRCREGQCVQ